MTRHRKKLSLEERRGIAERLREQIEKHFGGIAECARRTGLDRSVLHIWLRADAAPSAYGLMKLGMGGISLDELFGFTVPEEVER